MNIGEIKERLDSKLRKESLSLNLANIWSLLDSTGIFLNCITADAIAIRILKNLENLGCRVLVA